MSTQPFRLPAGGLINRARPLSFTFNGRRYQGYVGDTLASALIANGVHLVGRSFKYHRPRGIFGAGAEEPNALVQLESGARTEPNTRATQIELYDGLVAVSQHCWPSVNFDVGLLNDLLLSRLLPAGFYYKTFMWPPSWWMTYERYIRKAAGLGVAPRVPDPDQYDHRYAHCDVLVVGGGAAGLSAARAAARAGARVIVADEGFRFGGSLLHETASIDGAPAPEWARNAVGELASLTNVTLMLRGTVFGYFDHNFLTIAETPVPRLPRGPRQRVWKVRAKQVVLATGATERLLVFANNDRPGVMLASAARAYVNRYGVRPGQNVVVFTNNDSAYATALDLHRAGISIIAIVDSRTRAQGDLTALVREAGIEILASHVVVNTRGGKRVRGAMVRRFENGFATGATRALSCDLLCVSGGWSPVVHLFSQSKGRLRYDSDLTAFVPGASAQAERSAGAARGIYALAACFKDGYEAGARAAEAACFTSAPASVTSVVEGFDGNQTLPLWAIAVDRPRSAKSFVDLQNDVTMADIALAVREGYVSIEHLKRYTTLGMGTDQGKTSNINGLAILAELTSAQIPAIGTTTFRPPYTPVTLGAIAGTETGVHFDPVRLSSIHPCHEQAGARFINAGLWKRPQLYPAPGETDLQAVDREARAVRGHVGIVDVSTLGRIDIKGPDACEFLERVYVNRWHSLSVGKVRYGLMLREDGMVFDDGTTARLGEQHFLMTTTTANAGRVMATLEYWLQVRWPDLDVRLTSVTDHWAAVALAGPSSRKVLAALTAADVANDALPYMGYCAIEVAELPARVFRISFSGELAYEVNVPARCGPQLWEALLDAGKSHNITPYGTEAMAVLRIEKGHVASMELDGRTTPDDLGLGRMVAADKDCIGKRGLARPALQAPGRKQLVGLLALDRRSAIPRGAQLLVSEPKLVSPKPIVGHVTSTCHSPALERPIALALLAAGRSRYGERLHAVAPLAGTTVAVEVVHHVFVDPEGVRLRG